MAGVKTSIEIQDQLSATLNRMTQAMSVMMSTFGGAQKVVEQGFDTTSVDAARNSIALAGEELQKYLEILEQNKKAEIPAPQSPPVWNSPAAQTVFTSSGAKRFADEYREADAMAQQLYQTQRLISAQAGATDIMPPEMAKDLLKMEQRIQAVSDRVRELDKIPVRLRTDRVNAEIERIRAQLGLALEAQEDLNAAAGKMDVQAANEAYRRLNTVIDSTERNIRDNLAGQERFNQSIWRGTGAASGLKNKLTGIASAAAAAFSIQKVTELSDSVSQTTARLNLMNDGAQSTDQLTQKIYASANRAKAPFMETASAIAKMGLNAGNAFSSNEELIAFMEQVNKQFAIGGASTQEQSNAMVQLSQAMAAGALRGEELNSILDAAPGIARTIEQNMGWAEGSIKSYAEKGEVTAQVVKNSLLEMADVTNEKFASMPITFGQAMTLIQNRALQTMQPMIEKIGAGAAFINENWSTIEPVLVGVAAGILVAATAWGIYTAAQWLAVGANRALIASLLTNPFLWVASVIGVIVAAIYRWVQSVGGLRVAWLICVNAVLTKAGQLELGFLNARIGVANALDRMELGFESFKAGAANALGNLRAEGLMILQNFVNGAIQMVNDMIAAVNKIPGVSIEAISWTADFGVQAVMDEAKKAQDRAEKLSQLESRNAKDRLAREASRAELESRLELERTKREADIEAARKDAAAKLQENSLDYSGGVGKIAGNTGDTAANTAAMADTMNAMDEDLKYMRDAAEQEIINRFTLAELKIDLTNNNTLKTETDFDRMNGMLSQITGEVLAVAAEGGHL